MRQATVLAACPPPGLLAGAVADGTDVPHALEVCMTPAIRVTAGASGGEGTARRPRSRAGHRLPSRGGSAPGTRGRTRSSRARSATRSTTIVEALAVMASTRRRLLPARVHPDRDWP